jgi:hypothetical protein
MNDKLIKIHNILIKCSIKEFLIKKNSPKKLEVIKRTSRRNFMDKMGVCRATLRRRLIHTFHAGSIS